ncbi:MAG: AgmX/PglI C-terminal domain-containing protein [Archangium sp.]
MAELSESDLERLERYDAGSMRADEKAAFELELQARPELREALDGARGVAKALPSLASSDAKVEHLVKSALRPERSLARFWPLLVAAGLMAFGYVRFGVDTVQSLEGTVTVDARTIVAGDSVLSGNVVITTESSVAFVKRNASKWVVAPSSRVVLRGNVLEEGAVVISGAAPLSADVYGIDIDGEVVVSLEPLEGSFRETSHLEPGDVMNRQVMRTAMGAMAVGGLSIYVLHGDAWVTPPDAMPSVRVEAGKAWNANAPTRVVQRGSDFEQWPTDVKRPVGVTERTDAGVVAAMPTVVNDAPPTTVVAAKVTYPVNRDGIRGAMQHVKPELTDCYDSWQQQQPEVGGHIDVAFVIDVNDAGTGGVRDVHIVDGGLGQRVLEGCVLNVMSDLSFARPASPLNVTYPLLFSNDGGS